MIDLKPSETSYWFAHDSKTGAFHSGVTEPGQVTSTNMGKFEFGGDVLEKLTAYMQVADVSVPVVSISSKEHAKVGFYTYQGTVVQLKKEACAVEATLYDVVAAVAAAVIESK